MNKLSVDTARLISSLQVITKVENVVKELVENALDAGASCVEVKFENYGLSKIEVRDNGSGIGSSDIEYVAQRHYTSKISCKEDLNSLESYGFRGEALSSLCDVAEVFITTRTKSNAFSTKYSFNHKGFIVSTKPCPMVQGTTITANNLFAKMPVRCQFYQTPAKRKQLLKNTEDVLMAFALIHTEKRFSFIHNKCVVWQKPGCKDLRSTLENVLGSSIVSQMVQAEHTNEENQIKLDAFVPVSRMTRHHRKNNDRCFVYVNKRPVRDKEIEKIIKQHTTITNSSNHSMKWPAAFLSIELPPERVDSNVEADKSRVMISDKDLLLSAVDQMLSEVYSSLPGDDEGEKENQAQPVEEHEDLLSTGWENHSKANVSISREDCGYSTKNIFEPTEAPRTSEWSKGHAVAGDDGEPAQPVRVLTGHQGNARIPGKVTVENPRSFNSSFEVSQIAHTANDHRDLRETPASSTPKPPDKNVKYRQSCLNLSGLPDKLSHSPSRTPVRTLDSNQTSVRKSKKRKASSPLHKDVHNAFLITRWSKETGNNRDSSPVLSEDDGSVDYAEGQEVDLKFDFSKLQEDLSYKDCYAYTKQEPYSTIGALKDVKAGVLLDNRTRKLYLTNLLRLQEAKVFWSLMENHSIHLKELPSPVSIPVSSLSTEEKNGLGKLEHSSPDLMNPDVEYTDDRISKNGFKVSYVKGAEDHLKIHEMACAVSYYNIDDFRSILRKIGSQSEVSLSESRPFKVIQYLQAEAVRTSFSLPIHSSILECLDDLGRHFSKNFEDWKCFHDKPIFHPVFDFRDHG